MTMTVIVIASLFTAFEFLSILGKMSPNLLKKILGYEYFIDILMSFGLMLYFGLTGSVTGIIVSAVSGFIFSISLYSAKNIIGYQKLQRVKGTWFKFKWISYEGNWNAQKTGGFFAKTLKSIGNFIVNLFSGFKNGAKNANENLQSI